MELRRKAVHFILGFLDEYGYHNTLRSLVSESGVDYSEGSGSFVSGQLLSLIDSCYANNKSSDDDHESPKKSRPVARGDNSYVTRELLSFHSVSEGSNVLVSCLTKHGVLISGCSNKKIYVQKLKLPVEQSGYLMEEPVHLFCHSAGIISIDINPFDENLIVAGSMDFTVSIFDVSAHEPRLITKLTDHKKYVVRVNWSPSGDYLVTGSYDKSINVYRFDHSTKTIRLISGLDDFEGSVEGLAFKSTENEFIVTFRDDGCIYHYKIDGDVFWLVKKINMCVFGDNHSTFVALDISFSPSGGLILVSTDRARAIVFRADNGEIVGDHYGFMSDELSRPRHCWHPSGLYYYETCQDKCINVVEVYSQKVVHKLVGHTQSVRHLFYCKELDILVSSSFDGSVRLWEH